MPNPVAGACGYAGLLISIPALIAIFVLDSGIFGFVIAGQNWTVSLVCESNSTIVPLSRWLVVLGSTFIGGLTAGTIIIRFNDKEAVNYAVFAVFSCWAFAWNVIGWVALFRDSTCLGLEIGNVTLATLIFQLYFIVPLYFASLIMLK